MTVSKEQTFAGLTAALYHGAVQRPWLPLTMWRELFHRALAIGVRSAPTLMLMAFCVGVVIALVLGRHLSKLSMDEQVPNLIWDILNDQLAPMLTAVVFIARSVSGIAAELANMKIAEEIKALETMGVDLSRYMLLPVLGAFVVMLPVMGIYTMGIGFLGAYLISSSVMGMTADQFVMRAIEYAGLDAILAGAAKSALFALVAVFIAFHRGLNASGGSDAVGRVATSAVVAALVAVTALNAALTCVQLLMP